MEAILSILALGTAGGAIGGGLTGWLVNRQRCAQFEESPSARIIRPGMDDPLDGDVRSWTASQGIPDVNDLCPWPVSSPRFWPPDVRTPRGDVQL
jgi:hypothetical protein